MARLNFCAGLGLFCILASIILMVFAHISQISDGQTVPRHIRLAYVDTVNFGPALASTGASTTDLYAAGNRAGDNAGLYQYYAWGIWAYCGGNSLSGTNDNYCSGTGWGRSFQPASTILSDVPSALSTDVQNALPNTTFTSEGYLNSTTKAAFYLFFIGTILAGLSFFLGLLAHRFAFLFSAICGILAFVTIAVGAVIWTVIISRVRSGINDVTLGGTALGITVHYGNGLWITWAAAGAALLSVFPFLFACCCGRRSSDYDQGYDEKY